MDTKCVYAFLADDNTVKVGVSEDVERRKTEVEGIFKKNVVQVFKTEPMYSGLAFKIEKNVHILLDDWSLGREWFNCSYEEAQKYILMFDSLKECREELEKGYADTILNLGEKVSMLQEENDEFRKWLSKNLYDLGQYITKDSLNFVLSVLLTMLSENTQEYQKYLDEKSKRNREKFLSGIKEVTQCQK